MKEFMSPTHMFDKSFSLRENGKIRKEMFITLAKHGNKSLGLVELSLFGMRNVYTLIDFNKLRSLYKNIEKNVVAKLSLGRVIGDSPIVKDVNLISDEFIISDFKEYMLLSFYTLDRLISGMNLMNENIIHDDIQYLMEFTGMELHKITFENKGEFKYIIRYVDDTYKFSNTLISHTNIKGVFINIPEFHCWQYLSLKKIQTLAQIKSLSIKYSTTDKELCFQKIERHQEFETDSFDDILKYMIYIPTDIYFKKVFESDLRDDEFGLRYDALEIIVEGCDYTTSVLMTYKELGITFLKHSDFCLLNLINKIILLKPN